MNVSFRFFQESDSDEVEKMILSLYKEDPEGQSISKDKILKTFKHLTEFPEKGQIIVFTENNYVIGYAILIYYWSNEYGGDILNIDELYVKSNWRNRGIATAFFRYIQRQYKNVMALQLEVTPLNTKAKEYYRKMGFKETSNNHLIKIINFSV